MTQKHNQRSRGFTIIEVMIVLAIAGLIMLIVFLAVPGLQRSAANQRRKTDISAIAGAVANYISNNGGSVPASVGNSGKDLLLCGASCAAGNTETATLGYYDASVAGTVSLVTNSAAPGNAAKGTVIIDVGYNCNSSNTAIGSVNPRTAAVLFAVETGSSTIAQQCIEQ